MLFYLTTLNLALILYADAPILRDGEIGEQVQTILKAWNHSNFLCKSYILNSLDNTLYSVYSLIRSAKELWESLEKKIQDNSFQRE